MGNSHSGLDNAGHFHRDDRGYLQKCFHTCRHWLSPQFLAGWIIASTITYPLEHIQWDHIWPFDYFGDWLSGTGHLSNYVSIAWAIAWLLFLVMAIAQAIKGNRENGSDNTSE